MFNFDMAAVYTLFLDTIRDGQSPSSSKKAGDVPGVVPGSSVGGASVTEEEEVKEVEEEQEEDNAAGVGVGTGPDGITDISWSAAYPLITRWMLTYYEDSRVVADHYPNLVAFVDDLLAHANTTASQGLVRDSVRGATDTLIHLAEPAALLAPRGVSAGVPSSADGVSQAVVDAVRRVQHVGHHMGALYYTPSPVQLFT
jgi:hypothetical protein